MMMMVVLPEGGGRPWGVAAFLFVGSGWCLVQHVWVARQALPSRLLVCLDGGLLALGGVKEEGGRAAGKEKDGRLGKQSIPGPVWLWREERRGQCECIRS